MKGERIAKRSSFGSIMRTRLSDITNSESRQLKLCDLREHKLPQISQCNQDLINRLHKEKASLMKLVEERNKIIELSGNELRNMQMKYQKLQLQNWNLAQSNSRMLGELNVGRDKLKALQHELVCKEALLKIKKSEPKAAADTNICSTVEKEEEKSAMQCLSKTDSNDTKPCNASTRRTARSKSMGPSTAKRASDKEKVEIKRRCLRRQSARFKSQEREPLFEIEDVKLAVEISMEEEEDVRTQSSLTSQNNSNTRNEALRRTSVGRPVRRAVEKVQSYKEVPLNVKMRRDERGKSVI